MQWRPLRRLLIPLLLLIAAVALRPRLSSLDPPYRQLADWLPWLTLGATLLLGAYFNRSRIFAAALFLLAAYAVIQTELQTSLADPRALLIYSMLSAAVPAFMLWLFVVPERGLYNRHGAWKVAFAPALFLAGLAIVAHFPEPATALIQAWMPIKPFAGYILSPAGSAAFAVALLAGVLFLTRRDSEDAAALAAALAFSFITFALFDRPKISAVMFGAAGLCLGVSLIRGSHELAYRDELTGLPGRRALNDRLKGLGRRYAIAMLDVDHFKRINDTYGHDAGDDVLKMVAMQIDRMRGSGTAYRYGGEEFCIVFPGKTIDECAPVLEALRRSVARYRLSLRDRRHRDVPPEIARERRGRRRQPRGEKIISVTISIGLAEADERRCKPDEVIARADAALYRAKQEGRNRVVC